MDILVYQEEKMNPNRFIKEVKQFLLNEKN